MTKNQDYWKKYAKAWTGIKIRWGLTADSTEILILQEILGPSAQMPEEAPEANSSASGRSNSKKKNKVSIKSFQCGAKRYCKHMYSCEEAMCHLNQCGRKGLDRDKDGVPYEKICK